jgi:3D (Asp-Asp-Asp) domain-containing protein
MYLLILHKENKRDLFNIHSKMLILESDIIKLKNVSPNISILKEDFIELEVEASGYANVEECCYPYFDGKTSIGRDANLPGVAVDPKIIPYKSIVEVPGIGKLLADDCGGSIKGNKIDIRFPTYNEAINFGRKNMRIKIWKRQ